MSESIEMAHVANVSAVLYCGGAEIGEDTVPAGEVALALSGDSSFVIVGNKAELLSRIADWRNALSNYDNKAAEAKLAFQELADRAVCSLDSYVGEEAEKHDRQVELVNSFINDRANAGQRC